MTDRVLLVLFGALWVPTSVRMVHKMPKIAEVGPGDLVYDLGCGDGRVLITAARRYGARAVGFEIDPLRYLWCQLLIRDPGAARPRPGYLRGFLQPGFE